jgi:hypothetical protein
MAFIRPAMVLTLALPLLAALDRPAAAREEGEADKPLKTVDHDSGLKVDVLEIKPDKDRKLLTIRWRYRNPTAKTIVVLKKSSPVRVLGLPPRPVDKFIRDTYYLEGDKEDAEKTYRHSIVRDTRRKLWATPHISLDEVAVKPGKQVVFWAKFTLPVNTGARISLHLPGVEPIDGLSLAEKVDR